MVALADSKSDGCAGTRVLQAYINSDIGKAKFEELLESGEKLGGTPASYRRHASW